MPVYMRNKANGEIRETEVDSQEFRTLQREVTSTGLPMWEQTSLPHGEAIKERAKYGELLEEDLGHEQQNELRYAALQLDDEGIAPERNPHLALSPGEIEQGLTPEQKLEDLRDQFNARVLGKRAELFGDARQRIAGDDLEDGDQRPGMAGQTSALAGGSDDRPNAPQRGDSATGSGDAGEGDAGDGDAGDQGGGDQ